MSLNRFLLKYSLPAVISYIYSLYCIYLLDFVEMGDLFRYSALYDGVLDFTGLFQLILYQATVIGSSDPLYVIVLRFFFAPFFEFYEYIQIQVFAFAFLLGCLFFNKITDYSQPLRYILYICSLFSVYTLGLSTTLLRLQLSLIFLIIGSLCFHKPFLRNTFYILAAMTHVTSTLILVPLFFTNPVYDIKPLSIPLPSIKITSSIRLFKTFAWALSVAAVFTVSFNKFLIWLPVIVSGTTLKSIISSIFAFALLYPLVASKDSNSTLISQEKRSFVSLFSLFPLFFITLFIGGFRTLILAYFMSIIRLQSTHTPFLGYRRVFLSLYPYFIFYSVITGYSFLNNLFTTGYGY